VGRRNFPSLIPGVMSVMATRATANVLLRPRGVMHHRHYSPLTRASSLRIMNCRVLEFALNRLPSGGR
jgi:hypothetical protein